MNSKVLTSWDDFVKSVATLFDDGESEEGISEKFRGALVEWEGQIVDMKLDEKFASGIAISMTPEEYPLSKGRTLRADYLFLNVGYKEREAWEKCKVGSKIRFGAIISKAPGPFAEIQLSEFEGDPEVVLMIGLYECNLLAVIPNF
jgi:hypothetical protein